MQKTLCPHCMEAVQTEICPYCGNRVSDPGDPLHLPVGTALTGNHVYVVGASKGQGGFGVTYIALNTDTNGKVAIKEYFPTYCSAREAATTIRPYPGQEETYFKGRQRFLDEAKMLQSLSDLKGVVNVPDFFEANNTAYLVMEFLDGNSLKDHVQKHGKMDAPELLRQLRPLMADMEAMHRRGVIHRDIAPDNIILQPDGTLKLIDFGAARSYLGERSMSVVVKGGFAPVEQYTRSGMGAYTDVYALAATIYYCVTGIVPPDATERQLSQKAMISPIAMGAKLTAEQEAALARALEIQPADRTQSIAAFVNEMAGKVNASFHTADRDVRGTAIAQTRSGFTTEVPKEPPKPPKRNKNRALPIILAAIGAALALCVGLIFALRKDEEPAPIPTYSGDVNVSAGDIHEHIWSEATCKAPKTCIFCGETSGEKAEHTWLDATCKAPKTCIVCGETSGEKAEHTWLDATCKAPKTCIVCGETSGEKTDHIWIAATYNTPKTCSVCGATEGGVLGYPVTGLPEVSSSNDPASKDIKRGKWTDCMGNAYDESLRFWVCDSGTYVNFEEIEYRTSGKYATLELTMAAEQSSDPVGRSRVYIYADGVEIYRSEWIYNDTQPVRKKLDIQGADSIRILCETDSEKHCYCIVAGYVYEAADPEADKSERPATNGVSDLTERARINLVAAGNYHSAYVTSRGTVIAEGRRNTSEYGNKGNKCDTQGWQDIISVSAGNHTVGLKSDGTVVAVGFNGYNQCEVESWTDIIAIDASVMHTVGLRSDGTVVATGDNDHGQCNVGHWKDIIAIAAGEDTTYGVTSDGRVISAGKRSYGSGWTDIVAISAGPYHLVGLKANGTVVQTGGCDEWENDTTGTWTNIVAISAGNVHTVGLTADGRVLACGVDGDANQGQCNVGGWFDIIAICAGMYHTVGMRSDGTIVAVGSNIYGQLDIA